MDYPGVREIVRIAVLAGAVLGLGLISRWEWPWWYYGIAAIATGVLSRTLSAAAAVILRRAIKANKPPADSNDDVERRVT